MQDSKFIDYYEIMEISPKANSGTLGRMFRYLAQRYHPDNQETGDRIRFDLILEAHNVLKDAAKRAAYDTQYEQQAGSRRTLGNESSNSKLIEQDVEIQDKLLSMFYVKRRRNVRDPGIPEFELEREFDCSLDHLEFHLWYLREKGWIGRLENGMFAITIEGIDHVNAEHHRKVTTKLLTDRHNID